MSKRRKAVDPENPEWTHAMFARAVRTDQLPPTMAAAFRARKGRGKQKAPTKTLISLRLDREIVERYRATGRGWQGRMNAALERASKRLKSA